MVVIVGTVEAIAALGVVLFLVMMFMPLISGFSSISWAVTISILMLLLIKTWELSDRVDELRKEIEALKKVGE